MYFVQDTNIDLYFLNIMYVFQWLLEQAPHYFDLETWPEGETKVEIEKCYRRIMQEKQYKSSGKGTSSGKSNYAS